MCVYSTSSMADCDPVYYAHYDKNVYGLQAEWCPYCQELQPELNKFYDAVNTEKQQLKIVFVSSDDSEDDQLAYLKKHGPWWTIPFDSPLRNDLKRKVSSIFHEFIFWNHVLSAQLLTYFVHMRSGSTWSPLESSKMPSKCRNASATSQRC